MDHQSLDRIDLDPPLDGSEVAFLAGFTTSPVRDHRGRVVATDAPARVWPGQPRSVAPVCPCATGCCLVARPAGAVEPGLTAQWVRFLVGTFLSARHRATGGLVVRLRGGGSEVVLVEDDEVFEGVVDPPGRPPHEGPGSGPDGPYGGWLA